MRREIRVLGIDDAPFDKFRDKQVRIIGSLFRGGDFADGFLSTIIEVDGSDSTDKILDMIKDSRFRKQLRCIFLDGIAFGGFNVIDVKRLHEETGIPVIIIVRRNPDIEDVKSTLERLGMHEKIHLIDQAQPVHRLGKIYVQLTGISLEDAEKILSLTCTHSFIPEPVRVSHLIGHALVYGESKGNA